MTRPIYEPNLTRTDAYLDYQQQQLYRRPMPTTCPCPVEWALVQDASSDTINNNTLTTVTFESYAIASSATAIQINTATIPFKLVEAGWYHFWVDVEWSGAGFTDVRMAIMSKAGGGFWLNNNDTTFLPRTVMSDPYVAGTTGSWGPLYANCSSGNSINVGLKVQQASGVSKTMTGVHYSVIYLGPAMDIPTYNANWYADNLVAF